MAQSNSSSKTYIKYTASLYLILQIFLILVVINSGRIIAEQSSNAIKITAIEIDVKDVYPSEDGSWLHQFANTYHIKSKHYVITDLLSLKVGDLASHDDVLEAERLIRIQHYLRDAKVTLSPEGVLKVEVFDNWTLFPTVSFNRTGGKNKSSIGIRDTNFLGQGVATTLRYQKDDQKSGFRLRISAPTSSFVEHSTTSLVLGEFDVGSTKKFEFDKPFYSSDSKDMIFASAQNDDLETLFYQNDADLGRVSTQSTGVNLSYGWLRELKGKNAYRSLVGLSSYSLDLTDYSSLYLTEMFNIRQKNYIWWARELYENDYQVLTNVYILTNKEDINFGYHGRFTLGIGDIEYQRVADNTNIEQSAMLKLSYNASIGHSIADLLILQNVNLDAEKYDNNAIDDYLLFNYNANFFYSLSEKYSLYLGNNLSYVSEFRNSPLSVGGDTGLRGYPTTYQHGKKRYLSSLELRYYSDINLWDSISVGFVGFIDIGRAWDANTTVANRLSLNIEQGTLKSVGVGIRLFPTVVSGRNVLHLDFAKPLSSNDSLGGWEFRVKVENSF